MQISDGWEGYTIPALVGSTGAGSVLAQASRSAASRSATAAVHASCSAADATRRASLLLAHCFSVGSDVKAKQRTYLGKAFRDVLDGGECHYSTISSL